MINKVFELYNSLQIGKNDICNSCRLFHQENNQFSKPVSIWHVGEKFKDDKYKILFVGKTARGNPGVETNQGYINSTERGKELFFNSPWAYWKYTREIVTKIYGTADEGWDRIAFTNIIKCNNSDTVDNSNEVMKENCIDKLQVIWREIEILKPKIILFYTHWDYDDYIDKIKIGSDWVDISDRNYTVTNGGKKICWWERRFEDSGNTIMKFLRTSHPERQQKQGFVDKIAEWIVK